MLRITGAPGIERITGVLPLGVQYGLRRHGRM